MKTSTKWLLALVVLAPVLMLVYAQVDDGGWEVGELREDGLRIAPSGRSDTGPIQRAVDDVRARRAPRCGSPRRGRRP